MNIFAKNHILYAMSSLSESDLAKSKYGKWHVKRIFYFVIQYPLFAWTVSYSNFGQLVVDEDGLNLGRALLNLVLVNNKIAKRKRSNIYLC